MNINNVTYGKIKRVSKETGISINCFEKALNFFPNPNEIKTAGEARDLWYNSSNISEIKLVALEKRWIQLTLEEIKKAKTSKETRDIYYSSPNDLKIRMAVFEKWDQLSLEEMEKAKTVEEIREVNLYSKKNSETEKKVILKWMSLCKTTEEVNEVWTNILNNGWNNLLDKREFERVALEKWIKLSLEEIKKAKTSKEAKEAYYHCPSDGKTRKVAFEKWIQLFLEEVEKAETIEELKETYNNSLDYREVEELALIKIYELLD